MEDDKEIMNKNKEKINSILKKIKDELIFAPTGNFIIYKIENFFSKDKKISSKNVKEASLIGDLTRWGAFKIEKEFSLKDENTYNFYLHILRLKFNELCKKFNHKDKIDLNKEKKEKNDEVRFLPKIPNNTEWRDITIRFKNEYDVDIIIGKNKYPYDYETMRFADNRIKKSEERTKAKDSWNLLQLLAIGKGKFPLNHLIGKEREKIIKQKQSLRKILKEFFPTINDDPFFEYDDINDIYRIKIKLIPVKDFRNDFKDKNIKDEPNDNLCIKKDYEDQIST